MHNSPDIYRIVLCADSTQAVLYLSDSQFVTFTSSPGGSQGVVESDA